MQVNANPIAVTYLPDRMKRLLVRGVFTREQGRAAAMFCYYEQHQWMLITTDGTNFPKGPKIQTSTRAATHMRSGWSARKPPLRIYKVLHAFLVQEVAFQNVALLLGESGSRRTLHNKGKQAVYNSLKRYRSMLHLSDN